MSKKITIEEGDIYEIMDAFAKREGNNPSSDLTTQLSKASGLSEKMIRDIYTEKCNEVQGTEGVDPFNPGPGIIV